VFGGGKDDFAEGFGATGVDKVDVLHAVEAASIGGENPEGLEAIVESGIVGIEWTAAGVVG